MSQRVALWGIIGTLWWGCLGDDPTEAVQFEAPLQVVVQSGTGIDDLAMRHQVLADEIRAWNGLEGQEVVATQMLLIWPHDPDAVVVAAADPDPSSGVAPAPRPRLARAPSKARVVVIESSAVAVVESVPTGRRIEIDRPASVRSAGVLAALDGEADGQLSEALRSDVEGLAGRGQAPGTAGIDRRRGDLSASGRAEQLTDVGRAPRSQTGPDIGDGPIRAPTLPMPPAKACLAQPKVSQLTADEGVLASASLTSEQVGGVMKRFAPKTMACIPSGTRGSYEINLQLLVGCDGRVKDVWVIHPGAFPPHVATCIASTLRYAGFPAHGTPDGVLFEYPIVYRF